MEYYQRLDFPQIPPFLAQQVQFDNIKVKAKAKVLDYNRRYSRGLQPVYPPRYFTVPIISQELQAWMTENIAPRFEFKFINQTTTISTHPTQCEMLPHVDFDRTQTLMYYFDTGGENANLTWYQEQGYPIERKPRTYMLGQQTLEGWVDFNQLTEVASLICKPNMWYLTQVNMLHGVKNLTGTRRFLMIW